jgi:hypothetical protein
MALEQLYVTPNEMDLERVTRKDVLPEHQIGKGNYTDTGCNESPSCLACPLPACVLDGYNSAEEQRINRNRRIRSLRTRGHQVQEIANRTGTSTRTVHRVLQGAK